MHLYEGIKTLGSSPRTILDLEIYILPAFNINDSIECASTILKPFGSQNQSRMHADILRQLLFSVSPDPPTKTNLEGVANLLPDNQSPGDMPYFRRQIPRLRLGGRHISCSSPSQQCLNSASLVIGHSTVLVLLDKDLLSYYDSIILLYPAVLAAPSEIQACKNLPGSYWEEMKRYTKSLLSVALIS